MWYVVKWGKCPKSVLITNAEIVMSLSFVLLFFCYFLVDSSMDCITGSRIKSEMKCCTYFIFIAPDCNFSGMQAICISFSCKGLMQFLEYMHFRLHGLFQIKCI